MIEKIHWLGHSGFKISSGVLIYLDPFRIAGGDTADLILITHKHHDHCSPEDIEKLRGPHTLIVGPPDSVADLTGQTRAIAPGERLQVGEVVITAVPAYNIDKPYHPKQAGWVGYLVTVAGETVYHAGDTDCIPEMKSIRADVALLPVGGTYTMTVEEAARAALDICPTLAVPMHYGSIVGGAGDGERFCRLIQDRVQAMTMVKE